MKHILVREKSEIYFITPYKIHRLKWIITHILIFITCGILKLWFYWKPHWALYFMYTRQDKIENCTHLLINKHGKKYVCKLYKFDSRENTQLYTPQESFRFTPEKLIYLIRFDDNIYFYDFQATTFINVTCLYDNIPINILNNSKCLTNAEVNARSVIFGHNLIESKVWPLWKIIFLEVLTPFNIFQAFSIILWYNDEYELYATCIFIITLISIIIASYQIKLDQINFQKLSCAIGMIDVIRRFDKECFKRINSTELVVGDIVKVCCSNVPLTCDMILLNGSCIVNESMLTGESKPVIKTPIPTDMSASCYFNEMHHNQHILYCGTRVIETRIHGSDYVKALVFRTGYYTTKGCILKTLKDKTCAVKFEFERDCYKFIWCMFGIALIGFCYTITLKVLAHVTFLKIFLRALDIITIVVPPTLPAALSIGIIYAHKRLKKYGINCLIPTRINIAGCINTICFDKTGTLTEQGLTIKTILISKPPDSYKPQTTENCAKFSYATSYDKDIFINRQRLKKLSEQCTHSRHFIKCMATCHSLSYMRRNDNPMEAKNELLGDPFEIQMFEYTEYQFFYMGDQYRRYDNSYPISEQYDKYILGLVKNQTGDEIAIMRQLPFQPSLQRMSVITRESQDDHYNVYVKGAPETIKQLCDPLSIPVDFDSYLTHYALHGFRVLALAYKSLPDTLTWAKINTLDRSHLEIDLTFLGFVIFENKLKPESKETITFLKNKANIPLYMVSGDNILTSIYTATECGFINPNNKLCELEEYMLSKLCTPFYALKDVQQKCNYFTNDYNFNEKTISLYFAISGSLYEKYLMIDDAADTSIMIKSKNQTITEEIFYMRQNCLKSLIMNNRIVVFARMKPNAKAHLITLLTNMEYENSSTRYVMMCGDGANDSLALKAAHVGVALISLSKNDNNCKSHYHSNNILYKCLSKYFSKSKTCAKYVLNKSKTHKIENLSTNDQKEDSVCLMAPFIVQSQSIACILHLIREGKASLATTFGIFQFMAVTSFVQFSAVLIMHWNGANYSDPQFIYIDLLTITIIAVLFGRAGPSSTTSGQEELPFSLKKPMISLVNKCVLLSVICHTISHILMLSLTFKYVTNQKWYIPYNPDEDPDEKYLSHEVTAIFIVSLFQYIFIAITFYLSSANTFRASLWNWRKNTLFLGTLIFMIVMAILLCLGVFPSSYYNFWILLLPPNLSSRLVLLAIIFCDLCLAIAIEYIIAKYISQSN